MDKYKKTKFLSDVSMSTVERVPYIFSAFVCKSLTLHRNLMSVTILKPIAHRVFDVWFESRNLISLSVTQNNFWLVAESNVEKKDIEFNSKVSQLMKSTKSKKLLF